VASSRIYITEVRIFLGLLQFFRRAIARFSEITVPLTNLTKKNQYIGKWDDKSEQAFIELKNSVMSATMLRYPDWTNPFQRTYLRFAACSWWDSDANG
jgi:hypothetical protein